MPHVLVQYESGLHFAVKGHTGMAVVSARRYAYKRFPRGDRDTMNHPGTPYHVKEPLERCQKPLWHTKDDALDLTVLLACRVEEGLGRCIEQHPDVAPSRYIKVAHIHKQGSKAAPWQVSRQ